MSALTNDAENIMLDILLGKRTSQDSSTTSTANMYTALGLSTSIYVGLHTASPGEAGSTSNELSGNNYARTLAAFDAASSGASDNSGSVEFPIASGSWGTISHFSLHTAQTGGTMLVHGAVTTSKSVASGDTIRFSAGDLDISID
tara:strand:- start:281 stop:715 length:435 start_codon:yes stop_codon:yes gene_type:complete